MGTWFLVLEMLVTDSTKLNNTVRIIGVAGGSGSGKTYFAEKLFQQLGEDQCSLILQDNYYIDQSHRFDFDGGSVNFDHPDSLDFDLMAQQLSSLAGGSSIDIPIYDFKTHKRLSKTLRAEAKPFVIVDGILILSQLKIRAHFSESVFVDTSEVVRFNRRLKRDVEERGRTAEGVHNQFYRQVKPMHDLFVEPSKQYASFLIHEALDFELQLQKFVKKLLGA